MQVCVILSLNSLLADSYHTLGSWLNAHTSNKNIHINFAGHLWFLKGNLSEIF